MPVSYTHLDVYKRQQWGRVAQDARDGEQHQSGFEGQAFKRHLLRGHEIRCVVMEIYSIRGSVQVGSKVGGALS